MEQREFIKRMYELWDRANTRGIYVNSSFLTLAEQTELLNMNLLPAPTLIGGYDGAERKVALFGSEELFGYKAPDVITCIKIAPLNQKFADTLSHRDFLGALMNLGIKRELLGDIAVIANVGYLFCLHTVAEFICSSLDRVRHTSVSCEVCGGILDAALPKPQEMSFTASSERLDLIISEVFGFSRSLSKDAVVGERVSVDSRIVTDPSQILTTDSIVSVRGKGRFVYYGSMGLSKKGKYKITVGIYK